MRSWKILDVKKFMNIMLCREAFDTLLLAEASITGGVSYVIDGHLTEDFYSEQELEEMGLAGERCTTYGRVRPICFEMIKGKRTPRSFQFVFLADSRLIGRILEREGTLCDLRLHPAALFHGPDAGKCLGGPDRRLPEKAGNRGGADGIKIFTFTI